MGREIRRVPPNWEHPKHTNRYNGEEEYQPLYDMDYPEACKNWKDEYRLWEAGKRPNQHDYEFWDYDSPPNEEYYRKPFTEEPTWYQVYETVSEGAPVSPPFATHAELIDYLVENGDFWDQRRGDGGWNRKSAEQFVKDEWSPSFMMVINDDTKTLIESRDIPGASADRATQEDV